jgi:hypothetical protein
MGGDPFDSYLQVLGQVVRQGIEPCPKLPDRKDGSPPGVRTPRTRVYMAHRKRPMWLRIGLYGK